MTESAQHLHAEAVSERVSLGLWLYILSDCVLFAGLFATYAVQHTQTFGGPSGSDLFSLSNTLIETLLLLTSSFTCGLAVLAAGANKKGLTVAALAATILLGLTFVLMELVEFKSLLTDGYGWQHSAFLSSFFTLVGTHGLHVTLGLLWMLVLLAHIYFRGIDKGTMRKLLAFSIFWHFLDIIWIFIFTYVYLFGML